MAHAPVIYQEIRVVTKVAVIRHDNDLTQLRLCVSVILFVLILANVYPLFLAL